VPPVDTTHKVEFVADLHSFIIMIDDEWCSNYLHRLDRPAVDATHEVEVVADGAPELQVHVCPPSNGEGGPRHESRQPVHVGARPGLARGPIGEHSGNIRGTFKER
jgi:hypothetical protein